jgi:hypothetical protein
VADEPRASYSPLKNNGAPTTARAGVAFPENDWHTFPDGDQYLATGFPVACATSGYCGAIKELHYLCVKGAPFDIPNCSG